MSRRGRSRSDEGAGSVLTLAVAAVVLVLAAGIGLQIQAIVARARAQSVADLSALAAAREAQRSAFGEPGVADPCARATDVAAHNGGVVVSCSVRAGGEVVIEVAVAASVGTARAIARAGTR